MRRPTIIDRLMAEYVVWGGPVVTRAEALADCKAQGLDAQAIDVLVFGRAAVPAPDDPAAHSEMLRRIRALVG